MVERKIRQNGAASVNFLIKYYHLPLKIKFYRRLGNTEITMNLLPVGESFSLSWKKREARGGRLWLWVANSVHYKKLDNLISSIKTLMHEVLNHKYVENQEYKEALERSIRQ